MEITPLRRPGCPAGSSRISPFRGSSGHYTFTADNSGLCVDALSTSSGAHLAQYTCNGTAAQAFSLVP